MSEEYIIRHCAPTLAGLKTANMFTYRYEDINEVLESLRAWNKILGKKGMRVIPLSVGDGKVIVYLYRVESLKNDLADSKAANLLNNLGYSSDNPNKCLHELRKNLNNCMSGTFPHEIGLFLGYPPDDVLGFIEKKKPAYELVGNWKVYSNPEEAQRKFDQYRKCTDVYGKLWKDGVSIGKLAVKSKSDSQSI